MNKQCYYIVINQKFQDVFKKGCDFLLKYVLFDLDGTLTNPKEGITKCVQHALRHFGIERECDELVEFIGPPLKEQFMKYASLSEEEGVLAVSIYRERFAPIGLFENEIYEGIIPMLETLKSRGKTMALATSKPWVFAEKIVEKYGIAPFLSHLEGSELDGTNTDKALVIKNAMEKLGANIDDTIMIGDRMHDVVGAHKNGIKCIGVTYGYGNVDELTQSGADVIVNSPRELSELISEM